MGEGQFDRVKHLFEKLIELSDEEREAFLAESHAHGEATRRYAERLLNADVALAGSTARPLIPRAESSLVEDAPVSARDRIGSRIGAFTVLNELGHGGMGSVYLAERADGSVAQRVAIKIVRAERLNATTLSRFRVERQVLALLNHPNIASLIDLGELEDGAPFVVMEFVEGLPIGEYVRIAGSSLEQRLELFQRVCEAVQHAHRNLIVHRDIKPSNILVDADGRPKLIDFGIAKPIEARIGVLADEKTKTRKQFFSIGNVAPEYLVAGVSGIASDVYALGILLYELLASEKPFTFDGLGLSQIERLIAEVDPDPPSARLERNERKSVISLEGLGEVRSRDIRGDLDSIVMRCLRKNPKDRYDSVSDLLDDINRYRSGFPVRARRGGYAYRMRRFLGRNRFAIVATAIGTILMMSVSITYMQQRKSTALERGRADQLLSLIRTALTSVDPAATLDKNISAREMFERVAVVAAADDKMDAKSRSTLMAAVAEITFRLGEPKRALEMLEKIDFALLDAQTRDELGLIRARLVSAMGTAEEALAAIEEGERKAVGAASHARWRLLEASIDYAQGRFGKSSEIGAEVEAATIDDDVRDEAKLIQGQSLIELGRADESLAIYAALLADQNKRLPEHHPSILRTWLAIAWLESHQDVQSKLGDPIAHALDIGSHLYGKHSLAYLDLLRSKRDFDANAERFSMAKDTQMEIIALAEELYGADSSMLVRERFKLADNLRQFNDWPAASRQYEDAIDRATRVFPSDDRNLFMYRVVYGASLVRNGSFEKGKALMDIALRDAQSNRDLDGTDLRALAILARDVAAYQMRPTPPNRNSLIAAILEARKVCHSPPAMTTNAFLEVVASQLGVELPGA